MNKNKLLLSNEEGSIAILVAFLLTIFIGFMGLAVDFGYAYLQKTRLQKVADAEALACVISPASAPCPANGTNLYPELNPYGFTVTTVNPGDNSLCLNPAKQTKCARATAQVSWNTFFINLFGVNTLNLSATALAARTGQLPSCVTSTLGMKFSGGTLNLNNCSASSGQAFSGNFINGTLTVFNGNTCPAIDPTANASCISEAGPLPVTPSQSIPTKNIDGNPLNTFLASSCINSSCQPGIYNSKVTILQSTTLTSGIYVFNGGFQFGDSKNQNITLNSGSGGVGIYVPGSATIEMGQKSQVNLVAPSIPGCTVGSGIVLSHTNSSISSGNFKLNAGSSLRLEGVTNLTADNLVLDGQVNQLTIVGSLIANDIKINGNIVTEASTNPCFNLYESSGKPVLID